MRVFEIALLQDSKHKCVESIINVCIGDEVNHIRRVVTSEVVLDGANELMVGRFGMQ